MNEDLLYKQWGGGPSDVRYKGVSNIISDTHFGKKFTRDVPLNRKGDRERLVMKRFKEYMEVACGFRSIFHLGDLFDSTNVPNSVLMEVAQTVISTAKMNPLIDFFFIAGNHDVSSNTNKISSFDLFEFMCKGVPNIFVVNKKPLYVEKFELLLVPFNWFENTEKQLEGFDLDEIRFIYGHFPNNPVPSVLTELKKRRGSDLQIKSGHIHNSEWEVDSGVEFINSFEPLNHTEDRFSRRYIKCDVEELNEMLEKDTDFSEKCLIVRRKGEIEPLFTPDCLQFTLIEENVEDEVSLQEVNMDSFDLKDSFYYWMKESGLEDEAVNELWSELKELEKGE